MAQHVCKFSLFESIGGMRLYREVDGKKVYRVKCECGRTREVEHP